MHPIPPIPFTFTDEERLGALAMQFRGTRRNTERQDIAREYARTVNRLIQDGHWYEMPAPKTSSPAIGCLRSSSSTGCDGRTGRSVGRTTSPGVAASALPSFTGLSTALIAVPRCFRTNFLKR